MRRVRDLIWFFTKGYYWYICITVITPNPWLCSPCRQGWWGFSTSIFALSCSCMRTWSGKGKEGCGMLCTQIEGKCVLASLLSLYWRPFIIPQKLKRQLEVIDSKYLQNNVRVGNGTGHVPGHSVLRALAPLITIIIKLRHHQAPHSHLLIRRAAAAAVVLLCCLVERRLTSCSPCTSEHKTAAAPPSIFEYRPLLFSSPFQVIKNFYARGNVR